VSWWRCPECGSWDLDVAITTDAKLIQTPDQEENEFQTVVEDSLMGDHEWSCESGMVCRECGHTGKVRKFETTRAPEGCAEVLREKV